MPNQKRSLTGRIFRAYRAFFEPLHQGILPLGSSDQIILPNQSCSVTGRVQTEGFWPEHLTISNAGTKGGAADWLVNDIKIAGRSQFLQAGDIPGDMFATNAVSSHLRFEVAKAGMEVQLIVTYIGTNVEGCPIFAAITGTEYEPGLLDIVRALSPAPRGFGACTSRR